MLLTLYTPYKNIILTLFAVDKLTIYSTKKNGSDGCSSKFELQFVKFH